MTEIFGPDGQPVTHDNVVGDERAVITAAATGQYVVKVSSSDGGGQYSLQIEGSREQQTPLAVASIEPADGALTNETINTLTIEFNKGIRVDIGQLEEVTVNGHVATSMQILSTNAIDFSFEAPSEIPLMQTIELAAGAMLRPVRRTDVLSPFDTCFSLSALFTFLNALCAGGRVPLFRHRQHRRHTGAVHRPALSFGEESPRAGNHCLTVCVRRRRRPP